ncbi:MAG: tetraacyldisaccharide 4'-kinase [Chlamydiia bacterium]|nr:tetraacyldisaccharide 4'-kinase [Chlamydiia bacterium]
MSLTESYIVDVIEGRRKASFVRGALFAMSGLFEMGVKLRNFAFDHRWLREKRINAPVMSIGNIIAGGTGKTAFIQRIAKDLAPYGKVSILSRGYRSEIEKAGGSLHLVETSKITPDVCGDEAYLLFKSLPQVDLFVGKDRVLNAERAIYHDAALILLDDGMQYRSLHRDFEIVMLHADDLYGKGFFLPRGYLRDSPKRLKGASCLVVNHVRDADHFKAVECELRKWTSSPIIGVRMVPQGVKTLCGETWKTLKGRRVALFCGLGKPKSFFKTVEEMGGEIAETWTLPDHLGPTEEQLKAFVLRAEERGCDSVICSEKDGVKLSPTFTSTLPIGIVKAELEVTHGLEAYRSLLSQASTLMKKEEG